MVFETAALPPKSPFRETKVETQVRSGAHRLAHRLWELSEQLHIDGFQLALTEQDAFRWLAEGFLQKKNRLEESGRPSDIHVGYHYTRKQYAGTIQLCGLKVMGGRAFFGSGIYTANNPHAFRSYGSVGLIVLVIKGVQEVVIGTVKTKSIGTDCVIGNKLQGDDEAIRDPNRSQYYDEIVLNSHDQVLPLLRYNRDLVNNADLMWRVHQLVQEFVENQFPGQCNLQSRRIFPDLNDLAYEHQLLSTHNCAFPDAPKSLVTMFAMSSMRNVAAATREMALNARLNALAVAAFEYCLPLSRHLRQSTKLFAPSLVSSSDRCPICIEELALRFDVVRVVKCGHEFHKDCLEKALSISNKCPICRVVLGEPTGSCPFGSMQVELDPSIHCGGFEDVATIVLKYNIYGGVQSQEHENPGRAFKGTSRTAYIPHNEQGIDLVKRLRYAFRRGLTFHVGTSLTTGISDVVCWASIHHKTVLKGGSHGWPDLSYFHNCNEELDRLEVPKASEL